MKMTFTSKERTVLASLLYHTGKNIKDRGARRLLGRILDKFRGEGTYMEIKRRDLDYVHWLIELALAKGNEEGVNPEVVEALEMAKRGIQKKLLETIDETASVC